MMSSCPFETTFVMGAEEVSIQATWIETEDMLPAGIAHAISLDNSLAISFLVSEADLIGYSDVRLVTEKKRYWNGADGYELVELELTPEATPCRFSFAATAGCRSAPFGQ